MIKMFTTTNHCFLLLRVSTKAGTFPISFQTIGHLNSSNLCRAKLKKQLQLKMMWILTSTLILTMRMVPYLRLSLKKRKSSHPKVRRWKLLFMLMIQITTHIRSINISITYKTHFLLLTKLSQKTQWARWLIPQEEFVFTTQTNQHYLPSVMMHFQTGISQHHQGC